MLNEQEWAKTVSKIHKLKNHKADLGFDCISKKRLIDILRELREPPKRPMVDADHPSVRQIGTKKIITDPKTGNEYFCMLTDMHCHLSHGEPPRMTETWRAIGTALGTPLRQQDTQNPMKFTEEHILPMDEQPQVAVEPKDFKGEINDKET